MIKRLAATTVLVLLSACGGGSEAHLDATGSDVGRRPLGSAPAGSGPVVVDVALGYTPDFVVRQGGVGNARFRLQLLVELTNLAYANSGIPHRINLVGTIQVNYTDTNSQSAALEQLTGRRCDSSGCSTLPIPIELQPLRRLRESVGADLVALVRPFRQPEQGGCGHAWLLGAGGATIDNSFAHLGYSVVSVGNDVDETDGRTYWCPDTQLAHELGHNMGQAHNPENSTEAGAHSYSYGYRETSDEGFFTIMALPLPGSRQVGIPYFSNPDVNAPGTVRPTGTVTANNAASLNITMPLVAQFRQRPAGL